MISLVVRAVVIERVRPALVKLRAVAVVPLAKIRYIVGSESAVQLCSISSVKSHVLPANVVA